MRDSGCVPDGVFGKQVVDPVPAMCTLPRTDQPLDFVWLPSPYRSPASHQTCGRLSLTKAYSACTCAQPSLSHGMTSSVPEGNMRPVTVVSVPCDRCLAISQFRAQIGLGSLGIIKEQVSKRQTRAYLEGSRVGNVVSGTFSFLAVLLLHGTYLYQFSHFFRSDFILLWHTNIYSHEHHFEKCHTGYTVPRNLSTHIKLARHFQML